MDPDQKRTLRTDFNLIRYGNVPETDDGGGKGCESEEACVERYFAGGVFSKEECIQAIEKTLDCGDGSLQLAGDNDEVRTVHATGHQIVKRYGIQDHAQLAVEFHGVKALEAEKTRLELVNRARSFVNET